MFRGFHEAEDGKEKAFYQGGWHQGVWVSGSYLSCTCTEMDKDYIVTETGQIGLPESRYPIHRSALVMIVENRGINDKIYEGNIVKCSLWNGCQYVNNTYGVVVYGKYSWWFKNHLGTFPYSDICNIEVVGSIFDYENASKEVDKLNNIKGGC